MYDKLSTLLRVKKYPAKISGQTWSWSQTLRIFAALLVAVAATAYAQGDVGAQDSAPQSNVTSGPLNSIRKWLGSSPSEQELLPPELAFKMTMRAQGPTTLVADLTPAHQYYLYRDRISFKIVEPSTVVISGVSFPEGEPKADPTFGTVVVYHKPFQATLSLKHESDQAKLVQLRATYQGCNEPLGVCYPPIEKDFTIALTGISSPDSAAKDPPATRTEKGAGSGSDEHRVRELFAGTNRWALVAAFFGFGVLLAFTPCMLPMIPILSGIIVGQGQQLTRRSAFALSAVYVLAMAFTYALAGVAAGLAGTLISAYLQNPWVLGGFASIFVMLSLSMFGMYELQLPVVLQNRLSVAGRGIKGGKVIGAFLMGVLSAIIVGPCVAAPLAGALLYIGQTRDVVFGGTALFAMAIGMGVPLLLVGATAGTLLPKAGAWMVTIKRVFGVGMLAVAVYTIVPVVPVVVQQFLWAILLIIPAVYLHALDPLATDVPGYRRLFKGVGVLALLLGISLLVGALSGHREILQPLAGLRGGARAEDREMVFNPVTSVTDLEQQLRRAGGRSVMLDFWAEWCVSCKEMDQFTFSDSRVQARLQDVLLLRADVTANNADDQALLRRFALFGPPGIIFFDKTGQELSYRVIGYESSEKFLISLDQAFASPVVQAKNQAWLNTEKSVQ
ncbi:MAG: protein-disulfide reductase DsbD [Gammaproteobacteria bacterium]|nr:protein-disulfide reductase DsbD [Gammaproteobacteria bacterium]MBU0786604.1 protein-disulfide reductase DsbD [Gammaproteobacteria bacterium]MBU0814325.1 protein-disulfide reductase DsbD [Gammaproteobacteria bacterium]MBU1786155.1 protein-disulfide reductase DsbD [Gammaproteobacteria bacterium]